MIFVLKNVIQCICHNVAATCILLHTGWNAELNFQVSFFNSINLIASSCICKYKETKHSSQLMNSLKLEIIFYMYVECTVHACSINIGELSEAASEMN